MLEIDVGRIIGHNNSLTEVQKFFREAVPTVLISVLDDSLLVAARKMRDAIRKPAHYKARNVPPRIRPGRRTRPKSRSQNISRRSLRVVAPRAGRVVKGRRRPDQRAGVVFGKPSNTREQAIHVNVIEYGRSVGGAIRPQLPLQRGLESIAIQNIAANAAADNMETQLRGEATAVMRKRLVAAVKRRERAALSGLRRR